MWASVSDSSGPTWMNCDEVQQAVQPSHGNVGSVFPADRALDLDHPRREVAGRQDAIGAHAGARKQAARGGMSTASDTS